MDTFFDVPMENTNSGTAHYSPWSTFRDKMTVTSENKTHNKELQTFTGCRDKEVSRRRNTFWFTKLLSSVTWKWQHQWIANGVYKS